MQRGNNDLDMPAWMDMWFKWRWSNLHGSCRTAWVRRYRVLRADILQPELSMRADRKVASVRLDEMGAMGWWPIVLMGCLVRRPLRCFTTRHDEFRVNARCA